MDHTLDGCRIDWHPFHLEHVVRPPHNLVAETAQAAGARIGEHLVNVHHGKAHVEPNRSLGMERGRCHDPGGPVLQGNRLPGLRVQQLVIGQIIRQPVHALVDRVVTGHAVPGTGIKDPGAVFLFQPVADLGDPCPGLRAQHEDPDTQVPHGYVEHFRTPLDEMQGQGRRAAEDVHLEQLHELKDLFRAGLGSDGNHGDSGKPLKPQDLGRACRVHG